MVRKRRERVGLVGEGCRMSVAVEKRIGEGLMWQQRVRVAVEGIWRACVAGEERRSGADTINQY